MYLRPQNIEDAVAALAARPSLVVCGGTDVFPAHVGRPVSRPVVDLSAISALRGIDLDGEVIRIGGATTWTDIATARLPAAFDALKSAACDVGSVQIQNRGTIAGNLCNASPAADGIPPLLILNARVELSSVRGRRIVPFASFITGYRQTILAADEILSAVLVSAPAANLRSAFVKLGARRYLVISILMVAAALEMDDDGRIVSAAIAVGAASPVAQRLTGLESDLVGLARGVPPSSVIAESHLSSLAPIDDVRATAAYRMEAARVAIGQALDRAAGADALA